MDRFDSSEVWYKYVPTVVAAMLGEKDNILIAGSDRDELVMIRKDKVAFITALAREVEQQTQGYRSVREAVPGYFSATPYRFAVHLVLCSMSYHRPAGRMVSLPGIDEPLFAVGTTKNSEGLIVAKLRKLK